MSTNRGNVKKSDVHYTDLIKAMNAQFKRIVMRVRSINFNLWTGRFEVSETTTTIEPSEDNNDRR